MPGSPFHPQPSGSWRTEIDLLRIPARLFGAGGIAAFSSLKAAELENDSALQLAARRHTTGVFTEVAQAGRLGLHCHSRESGNPEAGQPGRHNKTMKLQHDPFNGFNNLQL